MTARFVVSLDFELFWGMADHNNLSSCQRRLASTRKAIPRILELFAHHGVHATWATVGLLFCETKDELLDALPELLPDYLDPLLSFRNYLSEVGRNESLDPFHFAPSLLRRIADTPHQEIGTHTFGHHYVLEKGASKDSLRADLQAAMRIATRRGVELNSIVFARNQYDAEALAVVRELGISSFRGNPPTWYQRPSSRSNDSSLRRALRLADSYIELRRDSPDREVPTHEDLVNVPATMFLRPYSPRLGRFDAIRLRRIKQAMTSASQSDGYFHLWWHPHNFGQHTEANLAILDEILTHYVRLKESTGMQSLSMTEAAKRP